MCYFSLIILSLLSYIVVFFLALRAFKRITPAFLLSAVSSFKILIIILNQIYGVLPIKPDSGFYFEQSIILIGSDSFEAAMTMLGEYSGRNGIGVASYVIFQSFFLSIFGKYEFVMPLVNISIYSIAVIYLAKSMLETVVDFSANHLRFNLLILVFMVYPAAFSNSMYGLRDVTIVYCFVFFMRRLLLDRGKAFMSIAFYLSIVVIFLFRPSMIAVLGLLLIIYYIIFADKKSFGPLLVIVIVLCLISQYYFRNFSLHLIVDALNERALKYVSGKSYPIDYNFNSYYTILVDLPLRIFYFLFFPFPWKVSSYNFVIPVFDAIFHIFIAYHVVCLILDLLFKKAKTAFEINQKKIYYFFISSGVSGYIILALLEFRFGGAIRHRIPFTLFLCCTLAYARRGWITKVFSTFACYKASARRQKSHQD